MDKCFIFSSLALQLNSGALLFIAEGVMGMALTGGALLGGVIGVLGAVAVVGYKVLKR